MMVHWARAGHRLLNPVALLLNTRWWKALVGRDGDTFLDADNNLPSRLIICDGRKILVTQNLHNALGVIQHSYPGYWWIDQLCINQEDVQERNAQVALMGQIYRDAFQVVVWLGQRTKLEAKAAAALQMMATLPDDVEDILVVSASLFSREAPKLFALVGFFSRSWFDRLWIVQEFAVARQAIFLLGNDEIPLETVTRALRRIEQILSASSMGAFLEAAEIPAKTRSTLLDSREFTGANGTWSAEKWLSVARVRSTTDLRDYVFGGLSLLGKEGDPAVPDIPTEPLLVTRNSATTLGTDYSQSVEAVYFAFSLALLSSDLGVNALSLVGIRRDLETFPSWTINLHHPLSPKPLHQLLVRNARVHRTEDSALSSTVFLAGPFAELDAVHFDEIQAVGEPLQHWFRGKENQDNLFHLTKTLQLGLDLGPYYQHTGELTLIALWRTLILESKSDALPSLDASFSHALSWYLDENRPSQRKQASSTPVSAQDHGQAREEYSNLSISLTRMVAGEEYRDTAFARMLLPTAGPKTPYPDDSQKKGLNDLAVWYDTWLAFFEAFHEAAPGRRLFFTRRGYLGMAPATAEPGDEVVFLRGAWAPYVLRRVDMSELDGWDGNDLQFHMLIGEGYVHGIMNDLHSDESVLASVGAEDFSRVYLI